jgi:hypothetical protein
MCGAGLFRHVRRVPYHCILQQDKNISSVDGAIEIFFGFLLARITPVICLLVKVPGMILLVNVALWWKKEFINRENYTP